MKERENKAISVQKYDPVGFLHSVLLNHAYRMSADISKLSARPDDWIKSTLLYEQGGYAYVACSLQKEANFRLHISINDRYLSPYAGPSNRTALNCSQKLTMNSI